MKRMADRSQRPALAVRASSIGAENAKPTMPIRVTLWRSASPQSSSALNLRDGRRETVPPRVKLVMEPNWPVPCINGEAAMPMGR